MLWRELTGAPLFSQVPGRGPDHRLAPRYEEVERQYASLPRYGCHLLHSLISLFSLAFPFRSLQLTHLCLRVFPRCLRVSLSHEAHLLPPLPGNEIRLPRLSALTKTHFTFCVKSSLSKSAHGLMFALCR